MAKSSLMEFEHVLRKHFREKMRLRNVVHKLKKKVRKSEKMNGKYEYLESELKALVEERDNEMGVLIEHHDKELKSLTEKHEGDLKAMKEKYDESQRCLEASRNRPATKVVYLRKNPGSVLSNFMLALATYGWMYLICSNTSMWSEYQSTVLLGNIIIVQVVFITVMYYISNLA